MDTSGTGHRARCPHAPGPSRAPGATPPRGYKRARKGHRDFKRDAALSCGLELSPVTLLIIAGTRSPRAPAGLTRCPPFRRLKHLLNLSISSLPRLPHSRSVSRLKAQRMRIAQIAPLFESVPPRLYAAPKGLSHSWWK